MLDYTTTYNQIHSTSLSPWLDCLPNRVEEILNGTRWGDLPKWLEALNQLPEIQPSSYDLNADSIRIGTSEDCDQPTKQKIEELLYQFMPWRKGPFDVFGIHVDAEWRSDFKWNRLKDYISPLNDKLVLDLGCNSGYHCFRMAGQGSKLVIGVDPTLLYVVQFHAMQKYIQHPAVSVLPIGIEDIHPNLAKFDTVFSMGLMYHRRAPLDHLLELKSFLRQGGELVLETLIIDGEEGDVFSPNDRYAKMANVWFIPSIKTLEGWLRRMGFDHIRLVDVNRTTASEQRVTSWSANQSLVDFLDPKDSTRTIEGYPAPQRAIFIAQNP